MVYYVNAGSVYAVGILFPVICTVAVLLRFKARKLKNVEHGPDDWMALVALIFTIALGVIMIIGAATHTIGWHTPIESESAEFDSLTEQDVLIDKLEYVFFPLSVFAIGSVRLTFAFLYRRIFRGAAFRIANWTTIGFITLWMIVFVLASFFQCGTHFSASWASQAEGTEFCPASFAITTSLAISDVAIDLMILILPIVPVCQLHMATSRKLLVIMVFALGIFSVAAGLTRMVLFIEILTYDFGSSNKLFGLAGTADPVGIISVGLWWSYMELGVGCLVSNLPTLAGLFSRGAKNPLASLFARISLHSLRPVGPNRSNKSQRSHKLDGSNKSTNGHFSDEESQAFKLESIEENRYTNGSGAHPIGL